MRQNEELTTRQGLDLIDELASLHAINLSFTGGEPLLRKDLFELIEYAKLKGIRNVHVNSNGLFNRHIAKKIVDAGIDYVFISLDGLESIHNYIRGVSNAYETVLAAVHSLVSERSKKRSLAPRIYLNTVITQANLDELPKVAKLARHLGIDGMTFQPVHQNPGSFHEIRDTNLFPREVNRVRQVIDLMLSEFNEILVHPMTYYKLIPEFFENPHKILHIPCYAGKLTCYISPYGDVSPCEPLSGFSLGNVKEHAFRQIWSSKSFESFREQIGHRKCVCWFVCYSSLNLMLSMLARNPLEVIRYALKRII